MPKCLLDFYRIHDGNARVPSLRQYEDTFIKIAESYGQIFIVLDALDECAGERREKVLKFIINLVSTLSRVKIFVTSRREYDIERAFLIGGISTIQIKAENVNEDIEKFVNSQVDLLMSKGKLKLRNPELKTLIINTLTQKSHRMYVDLT